MALSQRRGLGVVGGTDLTASTGRANQPAQQGHAADTHVGRNPTSRRAQLHIIKQQDSDAEASDHACPRGTLLYATLRYCALVRLVCGGTAERIAQMSKAANPKL